MIELLVVIAIIAILAAILFPVFSQAREKARAAACMSNMKQIGTSMLMYVQDYDETLPEPGLGGVFRNATNAGLGQLFAGVLPFHLAVQPYAKNYELFACPSDSLRQNASVDRSGMPVMLAAANVPGAATLPAYSNTLAYHEAVAKVVPNSYATNYYLSYTYGFTPRDGSANVNSTDCAPSATCTPTYSGRGRAVYDIVEPANVWIMTEYATNPSNGNGGWYTFPGYLNANAVVGNRQRWRGGRRHQEGRMWLFVDGHAKWYKDPPFIDGAGNAVPDLAIQQQYDNRQVFTYPK